MAFDLGLRRIGVACGETLMRTARPLGVVDAVRADRWDVIAKMLREWRPEFAVVGLPYNVDGTESSMTAAARDFARQLTARYGLGVDLVDERYSSLEAEARLREARASGLKRKRVVKGDVDATAACVILERWFTETT